MNRLKRFSTETQYDLAKDDFEYATVSWVEDVDDVRYMLKPDYSTEYLTFEALEDGTFTFTMTSNLSPSYVPSISYSIDNGETWITTTNVSNQDVIVTTPTIAQGNKVLWKSTAKQFCVNTETYPGSKIGYGSFTSTGNYNVSGNIMSLLYSDNFSERIDLPTPAYSSNYYGNGVFGFLFGRNNTKLVSAKNLIIPATNLTGGCYTYMFNDCTSLMKAPELPATTLTSRCYCGMFKGCTSLITAPELPATTLSSSCYSSMFYGCTSLTTAPELLATTMQTQCYGQMFQNCTSLTTVPELPATTLEDYCYQYMFEGCTSLTTAPELPATTLATYCYQDMFYGCTSLTIAPELPATTLVNHCYDNMFRGCTRLNYIKAMFTTIPSNTYTNYWVSGVASTGTFVKNSAATWDVSGVNGIPTGWTVQTASE